MKKTLLFISLLHALYAQTVTLTPEQEKNWQIKTQQATPSPYFHSANFPRRSSPLLPWYKRSHCLLKCIPNSFSFPSTTRSNKGS